MEVISPSQTDARGGFGPLLLGAVVGTVLVVSGIVLAVVAFATPVLQSALPVGHLDVGQMMMGAILWGIALVAPAAFVLAGASRLVRVLGTVRGRVPRTSPIVKALADVPDDVAVATGLVLPDGRGVAEIVVGGFGTAIIRQLPPAAVTRVREGRWELRTRRGWVPIENPLERASRDAERVRRWLGHDDADFVVKTYAAVVGPEASVARTPSCAVLTPEQIVSWIASLPPQRSLTAGRRELILERIRDAAG